MSCEQHLRLQLISQFLPATFSDTLFPVYVPVDELVNLQLIGSDFHISSLVFLICSPFAHSLIDEYIISNNLFKMGEYSVGLCSKDT